MKKRQLNESLQHTFTGVFIPKALWLCDELTPIQMLVMVQIHSLDGDFGCTTGNEHFAEFFGVSRQTMSEHILTLQKKGFVTIEYSLQGNRKTIRCARKFKLLLAGLEEEVDDYKNSLNTAGKPAGPQENTTPPQENTTSSRITLELHLDNSNSKENQIQKIEELKTATKIHPLYSSIVRKFTEKNFNEVEIEDELTLAIYKYVTDKKTSNVISYLASWAQNAKYQWKPKIKIENNSLPQNEVWQKDSDPDGFLVDLYQLEDESNQEFDTRAEQRAKMTGSRYRLHYYRSSNSTSILPETRRKELYERYGIDMVNN